MTDPARDDGPAERNNWNAILKWSLAQTDQDAGAEPAREISEADREWFVRAMESGMVDEIKRMKDITAALSANTAEVLDAEEIDARVELIEELNDRVCSIDNGGDLHTIGGRCRSSGRWPHRDALAPRARRRPRHSPPPCRTTQKRKPPRSKAAPWRPSFAWRPAKAATSPRATPPPRTPPAPRRASSRAASRRSWG